MPAGSTTPKRQVATPASRGGPDRRCRTLSAAISDAGLRRRGHATTLGRAPFAREAGSSGSAGTEHSYQLQRAARVNVGCVDSARAPNASGTRLTRIADETGLGSRSRRERVGEEVGWSGHLHAWRRSRDRHDDAGSCQVRENEDLRIRALAGAHARTVVALLIGNG